MIRVGTFNLNNLFDRFNFHGAIQEKAVVRATYRWRLNASRDVLPPTDTPVEEDEEGARLIEGTAPVRIELGPRGRLVLPKTTEHLNALIRRTDRLNADALAVQEVENIGALREFNAMLDAPYPFLALIEGNDPRFIDVGVMSRLPIRSAKSHRWVPDPEDVNRFLFSRDVLAVEILNHARDRLMFTIWVAHLKSKFVDPELTDPDEIARAQQRNSERRQRQAQGMHDIISAHHDTRNDPYVVCGDLNDGPDSQPLAPLLDGIDGLHDVFDDGVSRDNIDFERPENEGPRISNPEDTPPDHNWTHRLSRSNAPDVFERFDHMLVSQPLDGLVKKARIQRRTHWGKNHAGTDHDPISIDLDLSP